MQRVTTKAFGSSLWRLLESCFRRDMLVQGNSEEVGLKTTTAVVQSIFLVIVLDAVFAVFFSSVGWV